MFVRYFLTTLGKTTSRTQFPEARIKAMFSIVLPGVIWSFGQLNRWWVGWMGMNKRSWSACSILDQSHHSCIHSLSRCPPLMLGLYSIVWRYYGPHRKAPTPPTNHCPNCQRKLFNGGVCTGNGYRTAVKRGHCGPSTRPN